MEEFQQIWDSFPGKRIPWTSLSEKLRLQIAYFGKKVEFRTQARFLSRKKRRQNEGVDVASGE